MQAIQVDLKNHHQVNQFVKLPFQIYRDSPYWTPPLLHEAYQLLNANKNPFFRHSTAAFFLLLSDNYPARVISRVAVLNHKPYNDYNLEKRAFFFLFESENDIEAVHLLFDAAFGWAREQGLTEIFGPKGFSALDALGLLVKGHSFRPALGIPYHMPYYETLLRDCGFQPVGDVLSGILPGDFTLPEKIHLLSRRVQERRGLKIATFRTRRDLVKLLPSLQAMYNQAIQGTSGNSPLDAIEIQAIANQLLWFADLSLIKFILKDDRPVGFLFAYPDISVAIQKCNGKLWPFGWLHLLLAARSTECLNINGVGIIDDYRGVGGTAILFSEMEKSITRKHIKQIEIVQIGADNDRMLRELREINVEFHKIHRVYLCSL